VHGNSGRERERERERKGDDDDDDDDDDGELLRFVGYAYIETYRDGGGRGVR
jgi:hypothetical protein